MSTLTIQVNGRPTPVPLVVGNGSRMTVPASWPDNGDMRRFCDVVARDIGPGQSIIWRRPLGGAPHGGAFPHLLMEHGLATFRRWCRVLSDSTRDHGHTHMVYLGPPVPDYLIASDAGQVAAINAKRGWRDRLARQAEAFDEHNIKLILDNCANKIKTLGVAMHIYGRNIVGTELYPQSPEALRATKHLFTVSHTAKGAFFGGGGQPALITPNRPVPKDRVHLILDDGHATKIVPEELKPDTVAIRHARWAWLARWSGERGMGMTINASINPNNKANLPRHISERVRLFNEGGN